VAPVQDVGAIDGYDAVVLGSAVYLGNWMKPAKEFAVREAAALAAVPVWLFSSGPIGSPPEDPAD
jgi:menaquinone-dependent protoporphyrinogen oxidase